MVSLHTSLLTPPETKPKSEFDKSSSKKRKYDEPKIQMVFGKGNSNHAAESERSIFDIELHLDTPLPFDWQRCLDIQSGQVYFYNTRTRERSSRDPRRSPERSSPRTHMSLDLELNLPYESLNIDQFHNDHTKNLNTKDLFTDQSSQIKKNYLGGGDLALTTPSWLGFEEDDQEMVAAVCKRCFMLVMLCKSSPTCPNCKYMHPPEQNTPNLFKKRLTQLLF